MLPEADQRLVLSQVALLKLGELLFLKVAEILCEGSEGFAMSSNALSYARDLGERLVLANP